MIKIDNKTKQFLIQLVKILVVVGAFYFIYSELVNNDQLDWQKFLVIFNKKKSVAGIFLLMLLSFLNRYFEILKWKNLVGLIRPITVLESTKQVLAALTLGVFTPVGLGEYAGKALYFEKAETSKIIFLNIICNGIQMVVTAFFGIIGLLFLGYFRWSFSILAAGFLLFLILFLTRSKRINGYAIQDFISKLKSIPKSIQLKNIYLGIARYVVFTHQYYFLLLTFDVNVDYFFIISTISTVYLLASIVPSFQFLDFALKGGLAIYFFKILGVNEWIIIFITSLMWFLNIAVPVFIGCFYVLSFKSKLPK